MPISVTCRSCSGKLKAPDQAAGKKVKCPKCGQLLSIPGTPEQKKLTSQNAVLPEWMTPPEANATVPGKVERAKPTSKGAGVPNRRTKREVNVEDAAATIFLEGEQLPPSASPKVSRITDSPVSTPKRAGDWTAPRDLRPPTHEEALPPPPAGFGRFLLLGACGVAAILLLAVCYWIYTDRAAAQAAADVAHQAQEAAAKRQAEEERVRKEQVTYQQGLEQTALEEKRHREEAERRVAQLEGQQKQQAERDRARKDQLAKEEDQRKLREKIAADEMIVHRDAFLSVCQKMLKINEGHEKKYLESWVQSRSMVRNIDYTDPRVDVYANKAAGLERTARAEVDAAIEEMENLDAYIEDIEQKEISNNSPYKNAWKALSEYSDSCIEVRKYHRKVIYRMFSWKPGRHANEPYANANEAYAANFDTANRAFKHKDAAVRSLVGQIEALGWKGEAQQYIDELTRRLGRPIEAIGNEPK